MAELYWGDKTVLGIKPPGGEYIDLVGEVIFKGFHVNIPEGTTSLATSAFSGCNSLVSASIPSSVTALGITSFQNCRNLESIVIPSSVTSLGNSCFKGCTRLSKVYFEGDPPSSLGTAFNGLTLTIYHKSGNINWTNDLKTSTYGGASSVTWATY